MHILTDNGFLTPRNAQGREVLLSSGLYRKFSKQPSKAYSKKTKLLLATGTEITLNHDKEIKGLTFTGEIKNELETLPASQYKVEDYIFTKTLDINYYPEAFQVNLTKYLKRPVTDRKRIYYISKNVYSEYNENGFTMYNLFSTLMGKKNDKVEAYLNSKGVFLDSPGSVDTYLTELLYKCTKTVFSTMTLNKRLMDFLVISLLRGKTQHFALKNDIIFKTLSYKFNHDNEHHSQMYDEIVLFLRGMEIEFEEKEYDHYKYVNLSCEPLINFFESFKINNFTDLRLFSTVLVKYFIKTLYKYTNNYFYSNMDIYLVLKEHAYYNKIVLGYTDKLHSNYDSQYPISSFILEESTGLDVSDIVVLPDGYLTKIIDVKIESTQGDDDLPEDFMVIC